MPRKTDSDSEEEVKKSTMKTKRASKADVDAEEDANDGENVSGGDDEDDEPEYEIEAILDAKQGVFEQEQAKVGYFVKWKGYPQEDNSWVREEDAGNAQDLIDAFWKTHKAKLPKSSVSASAKPKVTKSRKSAARSEVSDDEGTQSSAVPKKRGRGRPSLKKTSVEEDEERAPKKPRQSNGSTKAKAKVPSTVDTEEEEDVPTIEPSKEKKWKERENWENSIERVDTVERDDDGNLWVFFRLKKVAENCKERTTVCYQKFPNKMFAFYEGNLRWRETEEEA